MAFEELLELNTITAKGFLMNDIISLLKKENHILNEENEHLLRNEALKFIILIKQGEKYIAEKKYDTGLNRSLKDYGTALNALIDSEDKLSLDKFIQIINSSENEIKKALKTKNINRKDLGNAIFLFSSIRNYHIKKSEKITNISERRIFEEFLKNLR